MSIYQKDFLCKMFPQHESMLYGLVDYDLNVTYRYFKSKGEAGLTEFLNICGTKDWAKQLESKI